MGRADAANEHRVHSLSSGRTRWESVNGGWAAEPMRFCRWRIPRFTVYRMTATLTPGKNSHIVYARAAWSVNPQPPARGVAGQINAAFAWHVKFFKRDVICGKQKKRSNSLWVG